ncbi:hypothetical protein SK803_36300 [Lentzea sp. BCCO 10_0856]|uniref:Uncharacterized protein n=1 Tax=Lentzea miocenica TaxID=3095431 RepID=A0ABU4TC16_9PSEU|nr:hypothetical protein [Lentzea sp. BCCO 10_0856]MDX8035696.1 hypothetical protein [Lentzea sp. BCCO 10_0856]
MLLARAAPPGRPRVGERVTSRARPAAMRWGWACRCCWSAVPAYGDGWRAGAARARGTADLTAGPGWRACDGAGRVGGDACGARITVPQGEIPDGAVLLLTGPVAAHPGTPGGGA